MTTMNPSLLTALTAFGMATTLFLATPVSRAAEDDRPVEDAAKYKLDTNASKSLPTIYLLGDSTVRVGSPSQRG